MFVFLLIFSSAIAQAGEPRAFLRSDSGYTQPEKLVIDGKTFEVSNPLISTYDIDQFDFLKDSNPEAWRSLYNHYRYGVAGTRGLVGGTAAAVLISVFARGVNPSIPVGVFLAGFIYGMNCRHMAKHNLQKAINQINGVKDLGIRPLTVPQITLALDF